MFCVKTDAVLHLSAVAPADSENLRKENCPMDLGVAFRETLEEPKNMKEEIGDVGIVVEDKVETERQVGYH